MPTPQDLVSYADARTDALIEQCSALADDDVREPSRLPGWSRGHVLTHLARNADALTNLFTWAATGVETPMYVSRPVRDAEIEAGSGRTAAELVEDLRDASARWSRTGRSVPEPAWGATVRAGAQNLERPAREIPLMRLGEVEVHRLDLGTGHRPQDWPRPWVTLALPDAVRDLGERAGRPLSLHATDLEADFGDAAGTRVTGTGADLLAWVTGRADGSALTSEQPLPELGRWR